MSALDSLVDFACLVIDSPISLKTIGDGNTQDITQLDTAITPIRTMQYFRNVVESAEQIPPLSNANGSYSNPILGPQWASRDQTMVQSHDSYPSNEAQFFQHKDRGSERIWQAQAQPQQDRYHQHTNLELDPSYADFLRRENLIGMPHQDIFCLNGTDGARPSVYPHGQLHPGLCNERTCACRAYIPTLINTVEHVFPTTMNGTRVVESDGAWIWMGMSEERLRPNEWRCYMS